MYKNNYFLENSPSSVKAILAQDANATLLFNRVILHQQLRFTRCLENTMREGPTCNSPQVTNRLMNSDTTITVVKAEPGLFSKYHMIPLLMVPIPVPACPYATSAAMIMSQSGASGRTFWAIPSWYQTTLDCAGRTTTSLSPDQLYVDSPDDSDKGMAFSWYGHPQSMPMWLWITLPVAWTRRTLELPTCDTPVFLDIALWDSPRADNRTMSSRISDGILTGTIATLFWNCNWCTATAHSWMYSIQMLLHNVFWSN